MNKKFNNIQAVILAGGFGSRLSEKTDTTPKPMVEVGGLPILWHILRIYASHGIENFILCLGHKGKYIRDFFTHHATGYDGITLDIADDGNRSKPGKSWKLRLVDTGEETLTGGRLARIKPYLETERCCVTYGDGVGNIDITALLDFHMECGLLATITAVRPPPRFGALKIAHDRVTHFEEKPPGDHSWINGGFFVFERAAFEFFGNDATPLEGSPLTELTRKKQLSAYCHEGFWHPMDTLRDVRHLNKLWNSPRPPWKTW